MKVKIEQQGGEWVARFQFDVATKDAVKAAGFRFDGRRKLWYTRDPMVAAALTPEGCEAFLEPAAKAAEAANAAIDASKATDAEIDVPAPAGLSYLPYQRAGIAYAAARTNTLIGDEMGLGKTIQAIGLINADPAIKSVLVVCPASLKLNWHRELRRWLVRRATIGIANGRFPMEADIVIINYDIMNKHRRSIDARPWDLLVVDECHYLKNPKADRTRAVLGGKAIKEKKSKGKIVRQAKPAVDPIGAARRVMMTGTPICNKPIELWPLVEALDPHGIGAHFMRFAFRYCGARQNGWGWDFSGATHLDELQAKLRSAIMVRRLKADVLTDLPPKRRQVIQLAADGALGTMVANESAIESRHQRTIDAARAALELAKADSDAAYEAAVTEMGRAARVAFDEMSGARHALALAKAPLVAEHVQEMLEETAKIVVMAHHLDVIDILKKHFPGAAVVDGRVAIEDRQRAVDRFQTDPTCRVFIGGIKAAGVGLTLTASSTVVFAELDWVPGNVSQAEDRCHRIGQRDSVLVQHLVVDGSLDARMAQVLVDKQDVIDRALDADGARIPAPGELPAIEMVDQMPAPDQQAATRNVKREALRAYGERMTDEQIAAVRAGLRLMAASDTDRAQQVNGVGFNKVDGMIGHELAERDRLSRTQAALGRKILLKYRGQLGDALTAEIRGAAE